MGWLRTIKELVRSVPKLVKKKVIRSRKVRSLLATQLGRILTAAIEIHLLAVGCCAAKWTIHRCIPESVHFIHHATDWTIDIGVPVIFSLWYHTPFTAFICWTFERPLLSLARRIQYMKRDHPFQYLRIKYSVMVPFILYLWFVIWIIPISREFAHLCLTQTLMIQLLTDFWPLYSGASPQTCLMDEKEIRLHQFPAPAGDPFANVVFRPAGQKKERSVST